jgi:hypothetical protein
MREKMTTDQQPSRSWRQALPVHPAADLLPLMSEHELQDLVDDIQKNGQRDPIDLHDDPDIGVCVIDGRNRLDALQRLGLIDSNGMPPPKTYRLIERHELGSSGPIGFVISKNIRRRHLTRDQKRHLITKLLVNDPDRSNRRFANELGVSQTTVGSARDWLVSTGQIDQLPKTKGKDGRCRPVRRASVGGSPKDATAPLSQSSSLSPMPSTTSMPVAPEHPASAEADDAKKPIDIGLLSVLFREVEDRAGRGDRIRLIESLRHLRRKAEEKLKALHS